MPDAELDRLQMVREFTGGTDHSLQRLLDDPKATWAVRRFTPVAGYEPVPQLPKDTATYRDTDSVRGAMRRKYSVTSHPFS